MFCLIINSSTKNILALEMEALFSVKINLSVELCEASTLTSVHPHINYYYRTEGKD